MPFTEFIFSYISEMHQICIYIYVCRSALRSLSLVFSYVNTRLNRYSFIICFIFWQDQFPLFSILMTIITHLYHTNARAHKRACVYVVNVLICCISSPCVRVFWPKSYCQYRHFPSLQMSLHSAIVCTTDHVICRRRVTSDQPYQLAFQVIVFTLGWSSVLPSAGCIRVVSPFKLCLQTSRVPIQ